MRQISSLTNPAIKALRGLHERKHRRRSGLFLAEGVRIVTEALEQGWSPQTLVLVEGREEEPHIRRLLEQAEAAGADCLAVSEAIMAKISRKDNPQMVLASFMERWQTPEDVFATPSGCWVVLDRVRDPGNLGTILRTADAVGASGVILVGDCVDAFSVESVRASMGAVFNVDLVRMAEDAFVTAAKDTSFNILGTALPASVDYREAPWSAPLLLLMGNEQAGLSPGMMAAARQLVRMPMLGRSDSLNLAVATGLCLYEFLRAGDGPGAAPSGQK
ncbi:TrmH family RNA methyltransferase [Alphaproteobacteria bacterium LSUCC0684]